MYGLNALCHSPRLSAGLVALSLSIAVVTQATGGQGDKLDTQQLETSRPDDCHFSPPLPAPHFADNPLAPKIFNWSPRALAGDIVFLQGANLTSSTRIFLDFPGEASHPISIINQLDSNWIAAQIPQNESPAFQLRAVNDYGSSSAIRINAPVPYHLDTTRLASGARFRIFGRNLLHAPCSPKVSVQGLLAAVDLTASRDYMLVVRAPLGITAAKSAEISIDSGNGTGPAVLEEEPRIIGGVGDPLQLDVGWAAAFDFAHRVLTSSAACDGTTDDTAALKRDISSARGLGATVQLPKGTCRLSGTVDIESNVVLRGMGPDETILRYEGNYPISADAKDLVGLESLQLLNAGPVQEGMIWHGNTRCYIRHVKINMGVSRQWFLTDNQDFLFQDNTVIQTGSYDGQNPYRFDRSSGLLFLNNRSINVNGSPTFQNVRDSAFLNNQFTRDASSQDEAKIVSHHGFVVDFAQRVAVIGNTFDVTNGPISNKRRNDGEAILVEGGGPERSESVGTVKAVGADFLSDSDNTLMAERLAQHKHSNQGIAIVSGAGAGQARRLVGYVHGVAKVEPPWDVQPEVGSYYASFAWGLDKVLLIANTFRGNPRGIWLYQTSIRDVTIRGNDIRDGGGIYLRSYQNLASQVFNVQLNTSIENNAITNQTGDWMSHIILTCVMADELSFGIGQLGIEVRRNMIVANQPNTSSTLEDYANYEGYAAVMRVETPQLPSAFLPKLIGPIFQDNSCINCETPFTVGVGVAGAVFSGNMVKQGTDQPVIRDVDVFGRPVGGSSATVIR